MTTRPYVLDPELEGLLREAAKDPGSALFRKLPREPLQRLALGTGALRASATELSRLDRHLVEAWRHELAGLLFDAALEIHADGAGRERMVKYRNPTEPLALDSPEKVRANVESMLEHGGSASAEPRAWLADWIGGRRTPTVSGLVALSHRLVPNPRVVVLGAIDSTMAGDLRSAEIAMHSILEKYREATARERAHEALALVNDQLGKPHTATRHYRMAHMLEPSRGHAVLSWFTCALVNGDQEETLAASREIESALSLESGLLGQAISNLKLLMARGSFEIPEQARAMAGRITSRLGPVGNALCEVLMS